MKAGIDAFAEALRRTGTSMSIAALYCAWRENPDGSAKQQLDRLPPDELRKIQEFAEWLRAAVPAAAGRLLADTSRASGRRDAGLPKDAMA